MAAERKASWVLLFPFVSCSRREHRLIVSEYPVPSRIVVLLSVAGLRALLPSAVLQLDAGSAGLGDETNFNLGSNLPAGCAPGESHQRWRLVRSHPSDLVLGAVGAPFEEASTDFPSKEQLAVLAAEPARPPFADVLAEHLE